MRKLGWLAGFVMSLSLFAPVKTNAAVQGIALSPAIKEVALDSSSSSVEFSVELANTTDQTVDLALSTLDFGALDESGGVAFLGRTGQESTSYGLKQWMKLEKDRVTLASGQSQAVKITIANRDDLSPGGHYGAVIVSGVNTNSTADNVGVLPAASTLVLLKKADGATLQLNLNEIKANNSWLSLAKSATLRFQNSGNMHTVPRGTVELFGPTGTRLARSVINPESSFVLPESFRQFNQELSYNTQPWLPGRYKLVASWRYDGQESFNQTVEYYWYMGRLLLGTLILSCLGIVLFLYIRYRRRPVSRGR